MLMLVSGSRSCEGLLYPGMLNIFTVWVAVPGIICIRPLAPPGSGLSDSVHSPDGQSPSRNFAGYLCRWCSVRKDRCTPAETLFKMIPKLTGDRRLHAQIPPVVIKRIAGKLGFLVGGATGYQIRPLAARGIVHIPVHQLAHARHLWPLRQRRVRIRGRFINAEGILFARCAATIG